MSCFKYPQHKLTINTHYLNFQDLGTAFTVTVNHNNTELRVYSGEVEVNSTSSSPAKVHKLISSNAIRYSHSDASVQYFSPSSNIPDSWLSQLRKIELHSTGAGKLIGQLDTAWVITHSQGQKKTFSTVIEEPRTRYERNSETSSWLTLYDNKPLSLIALPSFPHNNEFIFTTTFTLDDPDPETAFIIGKFWVDDIVKEIRINDVSIPFEIINIKTLYQSPTEFIVNSNFKRGLNTLSFVVQNGGPNPSKEKLNQTSQMAFRAELTGHYHRKKYPPKSP